MTRISAVVFLVFISLNPALAEERPAPAEPVLKTRLAGGKVVVWVAGQLRDRFEFIGKKDFNTETDDEFISQRARIGIGAGLDWLKVFVQLQDVRLWGEEADTLADYAADGFDVHQAWAELRLAQGLFVQVGRMELPYDNHRLMGNVNWTQQGRSFDGARLKFEHKMVQAQMFYSKVAEMEALSSGVGGDRDLVGLWARMTRFKFFKPSIIYLFDTDLDTDRFRHTFGAHITGSYKGLNYTVEAYGQLGEESDLNLRAFLAAVRAGYTAPVRTNPSITGWAEIVSGDNDLNDSTRKSFHTMFATNHKFYGFMDLFLNLPLHTGGRGLVDAGARFKIKPFKGFSFWVDYHAFQLMYRDDLGDLALGHEIDVTARYVFRKYVQLQVGYSAFIPQAAMNHLKNQFDDPEHWAYVQTNVMF
jgi:hypothetical protein